MDAADELLVFKYDAFKYGLARLYDALSTSEAHREAFIRNPADYLTSSLLPESDSLTRAQLSSANRLIFALLSNPHFMDWAREFQSEIRTNVQAATSVEDEEERLRLMTVLLDRTEVRRRMAEGIRDHGDIEGIAALLELPAGPSPQLPRTWAVDETFAVNQYVAIDFAFGFFVVAIVVTQIDFTPMPPEPADRLVNRAELQQVTTALAASLEEHASEIRNAGGLKA
jgi:hypothetical protein